MKSAFAVNYGQKLLNQTEAARAAGYADPTGETHRLMSDPAVVGRIIEHLRKQATKWQVLVVKAKKTLLEGMDADRIIVLNKDGETQVVPDTRSRLEAARIVLMTLKRDGKALLEDAANEEDAAAETSIALAKRILGVPVPGEPIH